jgi:hypothetical protein
MPTAYIQHYSPHPASASTFNRTHSAAFQHRKPITIKTDGFDVIVFYLK